MVHNQAAYSNILVDYHLPRQNRENLVFRINLDLPLQQGVVGVFGNSGTGKSSLLKALAGLIKDANCSVSLAGEVYENVKATHNPCVYVGAESILFEHLNVTNNLRLVQDKGGFASKARLSLQEVIDWCGIQTLLEQKPSELSSGEQQRVKFARALLSGKPCVLLDEAFSALDWRTRRYFSSLLTHLHTSYGLLFIMVSHSLRELALCCHSIIHLHEGQIKAIDETQNMIDRLQHGDVDQNQASQSHDTNEVFSLLYTQVVGYDAEANLVECELILNRTDTQAASKYKITPSTPLFFRSSEPIAIGTSQKLTIDADKVSLASSEDVNTSMLNCVQGKVQAIEIQQGVVLITLLIEKQKLRSRISIRSFKHLAIKQGDILYALFKAL